MPKQKSLEARLATHPELKEKVMALLELAESDIQRADDVEALLVDLCRDVGKQTLQDWTKQRERQTVERARRDDPGLGSNGKKNSTG